MKILFAVAAAALAFAVHAQDYPTKTIRLIIPLTPGSGADIAGRIIAQRMSEHWKQPVLVENRPGAGGQIGTAAVVKGDADGHTLLVQSSSHSANPAIYKNLPYDPLKDLADVAILGKTPYVMVSAQYKSLKSLLDDANKKPGQLAFASAGVDTSTHLAAEYLVGLAGVKMIHVPYKGSAEAIQDVLGGRVQFYMAPVNVAGGQVKEGKLSPLGVSTKRPAASLPDVPSLASQGIKDYDVTLWFGMWAPSGTPIPVLQKINGVVNAIVFEPAVKEQFTKLGIEPAPMKTDEFAKFVRSEMDVYKRIVQAANIPQQ